jgi:hypothetical protein
MTDVSRLLGALEQGDPTAAEELLPLVYEELRKLAVEYPEQAALVRLRFFTGLSLPEAAQALHLSETTAKRYWRFARAWRRSVESWLRRQGLTKVSVNHPPVTPFSPESRKRQNADAKALVR